MALVNTTDPQRAAESLAAWWEKRNHGDTDVVVADIHIPHSAGMSSETLLFDLHRTSPNGHRCTERLAARVIVPGGEVFPDYDLHREALAMRTVRATTDAPVPAVITVEDDSSILGGPFLLMEQLEGQTLGDDPPFTVAGWFTELNDTGRAAVFENGLVALSQVHRADISDLPSTILGSPDYAEGSATAQHVRHWAAFYQFARNGTSHRVVEAALTWLDEHLPRIEGEIGLVWGDARLGNMMFDEQNRVTAVLDWELLALGPPEIDLGWFAFLNRMYTEGLGVERSGGVPTQAEMLSRYSELAHRATHDSAYYEVLAGTRLSIVMMRLAHMLMDKGLMPVDHAMPITNPATVVLAGLLGIDPPGTETGWVTGHR
jgi:aminoglycoside phosphotransferase (APT) family kinase protein